MKLIREITIKEREKWNYLVHSFENYDVFYLYEYALAFAQENPQNGEPILLVYENGLDRAINVVFKRDVAKDEKFSGKLKEGKYFDLVSPYGYGGFWGNVKDYLSLNKEYNEYCIAKGYICEFVRFELFSEYQKNYDGQVETRTHNVVRDLQMPIEDIWMDFKSKVRKNVKRAQKNNLEILIENKGTYLQEFLDIYYGTMERDHAKKDYYFSKEFFETINEMQDNIMYFHAVADGKIVSTELVIFGSEICYSYLGGTNENAFALRPNDFLKFEIIKWANKNGFKYFVLGGGYGSDDGIFRYKFCLAPKGVVDFYIGKKIFNRKQYTELVNIRKGENPESLDLNYFPVYRA